MRQIAFEKFLTANDTGQSGSHQAGIHIPKSNRELVAFLPSLDPAVRNPDAWLTLRDPEGRDWQIRYIHYNNSLHDDRGTRDEYRLTHIREFLKEQGAQKGDVLRISKAGETAPYSAAVIKVEELPDEPASPKRIKLSGWRKVH